MGNILFQKDAIWGYNVGETFKRVMEITFHGNIGQSVVAYLDDVIVFSKK